LPLPTCDVLMLAILQAGTGAADFGRPFLSVAPAERPILSPDSVWTGMSSWKWIPAWPVTMRCMAGRLSGACSSAWQAFRVSNSELGWHRPVGIVSLGRDIGRASDPPPRPSATSTLVPARFNIVGPDYFTTLGISLLQGRPFAAAQTAADTKSAVAILDKAAAARLWPHEDAVGKHIP